MPKSKTDKSRQGKVVKFKEQTKKENEKVELPKIKPFRQVPQWEPDAKIVLTGKEFSMLQNYFNIFAEPIQIMQDVFTRSLNEGIINIKYVDNDGKEISKEEVAFYMEEMKKYFQAKAEETINQQVEVTDVTSETPVPTAE